MHRRMGESDKNINSARRKASLTRSESAPVQDKSSKLPMPSPRPRSRHHCVDVLLKTTDTNILTDGHQESNLQILFPVKRLMMKAALSEPCLLKSQDVQLEKSAEAKDDESYEVLSQKVSVVDKQLQLYLTPALKVAILPHPSMIERDREHARMKTVKELLASAKLTYFAKLEVLMDRLDKGEGYKGSFLRSLNLDVLKQLKTEMFKLQQEQKTHIAGNGHSGRIGLTNIENNCYANAVIQALFMTKALRFHYYLLNTNKSPLLNALRSLFINLQFSKYKQISGYPLMYMIKSQNSTLGVRQDSYEFLIHMLNTLHDEEAKIRGSSSNKKSALHKVFGGEISWKSTCDTCLSEQTNVEWFYNLILVFPQTIPKYFTVQTSIDAYFDSNILCYCKHCDSKTMCRRIAEVTGAPPVLILNSQIFITHPESIANTKITYSLQMNRYIKFAQSVYVLYAIIVHKGDNIHSGHFMTCASENSCGQWFKFDDENVMPSSCNIDPLETPYILFYRNTNTPSSNDLNNYCVTSYLSQTNITSTQMGTEVLSKDSENKFITRKQDTSNTILKHESIRALFIKLKLDSQPQKKDATLFIRNIPDYFKNRDLAHLFSKYGNIAFAMVILNEDGTSAGHGFVGFACSGNATVAWQQMVKYAIGNQLLDVQIFNYK